jgi:glycosyltransferase involved in cell wall biosynthesis
MLNKKIMFLSSFNLNNTAGGIERTIVNYANYFSEAGNDISIAYEGKKYGKCFFDINNKIKTISLGENRIIILCNYIINIIKHKPDIIISAEAVTNKYAAIASFIRKNIIVIGTEHAYAGLPFLINGRFGRKYKLLTKYLHSKLDTLVVLTQASADYLIENTIANNVEIIPNPLVYPLPKNKPMLLPEDTINSDKNTLVAVGRLTDQKGFDLLIPVFANLVKKYKNWQLVILGEGECRTELEKQINQLKLQNKVFLPGSVGNVADWHKKSDIFVLSSHFEGLPCALIEAMAHGLPAVSFNCKSGPSDIIRHGIDGFLVEYNNTEELFKALEKLIIDNKLRQNFAEKALEVRERFNIVKIGSMWQDLFIKLEKNKEYS